MIIEYDSVLECNHPKMRESSLCIALYGLFGTRTSFFKKGRQVFRSRVVLEIMEARKLPAI